MNNRFLTELVFPGLIFLIFAVGTLPAQKPKPSPIADPVFKKMDLPGGFILTHEQTLELELRQERVRSAYKDILAAQVPYNAAFTDLKAEAMQICKTNGWDCEKDVQFDPQTLTFKAIPVAAATASPKPGSAPTPATPAPAKP